MFAKVKCEVHGDTGPACNSVGMIDRKLLGIQHLYKRPIYARTKDCSINSPDYGPLPPNAPSWCQAPFDPEGLLRLDVRLLQFVHRPLFFYLIIMKSYGERPCFDHDKYIYFQILMNRKYVFF